ncbi:ATP synthase F0 subcomplex A subunit [Paraoerskovia marina]|uniref:ATP synthase subunit a n=1 Tax=Paraoerskovia marina TaxID=545619 RepID=A0A1H1R3V9_9CELL|nr:F0F1 ATP synthase subunit A [Paraoerskovia marina]SDS30484.1 ATP synthase F0 subcomplex A subunit [Paraoerskovia marina]
MCPLKSGTPDPDPWESPLFTLAAPLTVVASAEGEGGGFHAPSITDFFPPAIFFEGTIFEFNRVMLIRVIMTIVLLAIFVIAARRAKLVPGRFQNAIEMILDFVRINIVGEIMGEERGRRYVPMITVIFLTVLTFNISGVIPFMNLAGTALIGLPVMLALWVFVTYWVAGIRKHGFGGYLKANLFPPGVPKPIYVIVAPIELLQILIIRPASLAIRLMANMVAGHIMLVLCFSATSYFLFEAAPALKAFGVLTFAGGFAFTLFELLVAALQAYIFGLLASVYINLSLDEEH